MQDPQNTGTKSMMTEQENGAPTTIESTMTGTKIPVTVKKSVLGAKKAMGITTKTGGIAGVTIEPTEITTKAHQTEIRKRPHKAGAQVHHPNPEPKVLRNRIECWSGEVILRGSCEWRAHFQEFLLTGIFSLAQCESML